MDLEFGQGIVYSISEFVHHFGNIIYWTEEMDVK